MPRSTYVSTFIIRRSTIRVPETGATAAFKVGLFGSAAEHQAQADFALHVSVSSAHHKALSWKINQALHSRARTVSENCLVTCRRRLFLMLQPTVSVSAHSVNIMIYFLQTCIQSFFRKLYEVLETRISFVPRICRTCTLYFMPFICLFFFTTRRQDERI